MSDPRVYNLDHFTEGQVNDPGKLQASLANSLPKPFHVCIIGASNGTGAGLALAYARAGCTAIVLASRDIASMESVAEAIRSISPSTTIHIQACDIASASSVLALSKVVTEKLGSRLDVLAINSGYSGSLHLKITDGSPEDGEWAQAFSVNTLGTYHAAHYFVPLLLASPAGSAKAFVVVGSIASAITKGIIANTKYCVAKLAQLRILEHMSHQFREEGLFTVAVHPGSVLTPTASLSAPEEFMKCKMAETLESLPELTRLPDLIDDPELCGTFCVWLTRDANQLRWLSGRLLSANWDPEELLSKKDDIVKGDLLKFAATTRIQS